MIVVDTNVILACFLETEQSEAVRRLNESGGPWVAPPLWRSESRNALALYIRTGRLTVADAVRIQRAGEDMMEGSERGVDSEDVLRLTESSGCTAYDCEFVALAVRLDTPLLTFDRKILREFGPIAIRPDSA